MKVASDVLLLLCLHDFGLRVSVELGQASAFLYSEARLYTESVRKVMRLIFLCKKYPSDGADFLGKHGGV